MIQALAMAIEWETKLWIGQAEILLDLTLFYSKLFAWQSKRLVSGSGSGSDDVWCYSVLVPGVWSIHLLQIQPLPTSAPHLHRTQNRKTENTVKSIFCISLTLHSSIYCYYLPHQIIAWWCFYRNKVYIKYIFVSTVKTHLSSSVSVHVWYLGWCSQCVMTTQSPMCQCPGLCLGYTHTQSESKVSEVNLYTYLMFFQSNPILIPKNLKVLFLLIDRFLIFSLRGFVNNVV